MLDTGEALFAQHGFAGVGLREVAVRVGLSKSALFHHFPSKSALYVAVLERVLLNIEARLSGSDRGTAVERLHAWINAIVDVLAEHPTHAPLLLRTVFEAGVLPPDDDQHLNGILEQILKRVASALKTGMASGELRKASIPHTLQTLIGLTVYHFATGEFGDNLMGRPIYSAAEVRRRKQHIYDFIQHGLVSEQS
jgi:AcrR family transcriptional regulator